MAVLTLLGACCEGMAFPPSAIASPNPRKTLGIAAHNPLANGDTDATAAVRNAAAMHVLDVAA